MASNNNNNSNNNGSPPAHLSFAGNLTPEDIQELLGAMSGEHHEAETGASQPRPTVSDGRSGRAESSSSDGSESKESSSSDRKDGDDKDVVAGIAPTKEDISEDSKAQARSQRKRCREKQRRSDVNKQFADLTQLLRQIEADESEDEAAKRRLSFNPTNRVDLIAKTIFHLERLHECNKKRKTELDSLQQQLDQSKKAGEDTAAKLKEAMFNSTSAPSKQPVMMMVPMMMSPDGMSSTAAMPMMNPFMAPQPFLSATHSQQASMMQQMQQPPQQQQTHQQQSSQQISHQQLPQQQPHTATIPPRPPAQQNQTAMHVTTTNMQPAPPQMSFPSFPMAFPMNAGSVLPQQAQMPYMVPSPMGNPNAMITPANPQVVAVPPQQQAVSVHQNPNQTSTQVVSNSNTSISDAGGTNGSGTSTGGKPPSSLSSGGNLAHCA